MSVALNHAQYDAYRYTWQALRDAAAGSGHVKAAPDTRASARSADGVRLAGTKYLPRPSGMRLDSQYAAYRDRASVSNAPSWVVFGLTGAIFRREPQVEVPTTLEPQLRNVTRTGLPLRTFAEDLVRETLLMGRYGVLLDFPAPTVLPSGQILSPPPGARPYWIPYATEEIVHWHSVEREGAEHLDMIVLEEGIPMRQGPWGTDDYFVIKTQLQRRVLRLNEQGVYEVSVWVQVPGSLGGTAATFAPTQVWVPLRLGEPLTFIPFVTMTPLSLRIDVVQSLMEPLVEIAFRYFRHSADYEHALHLTSLPTPWIAGDLDPLTELLIGSLTAWVLPAGAQAGMLEYKGQGLQPHEHAMQQDLHDMAARGASLLEVAPLVPETMTAMVTRTQGSESPIQTLIRTVSEGVTQLLRWHAWWSAASDRLDDPSISYHLNTKIAASTMEPQRLTALMQAYLNHTISYETWYYQLQQGEVARPGVDAEDEQMLIEDQQAQQLALLPPTPPIGLPPGRNGARPLQGVAA
jgi:hypothetical protein